jgi:hypothetical protein
MNQLKYWINKNLEIVDYMLWNIRKKNLELNTKYNKMIDVKTKFEIKYQRLKERVNKFEEFEEFEDFESLNVLIESMRNISNANTNDLIIASVISNKLFDSLIIIDNKNSNIEDWLSAMRNKLKRNVDWYSKKTSKKTYILTRIENDVSKHLISRFKKNFIKSFLTAKEIFDDLNKVFDDLNKRLNVLKTYKRLKQVEVNKEFHTFWAEF